jgi:hypothetical protein
MRIHWMVRLYPHTWQERYGDEFMAVLEQHTPTIKTCLDIVLNALDAHIDPTAWGPRSSFAMDTFKRLRRSTGIIFVAFIAMLLSYVLFLSDLGDIFDWITRHNPFTNFLNGILSNMMDLQLAALLVALLLVASALAFQKGATSSKILRFLPLVLVLFPTVMAGFYYGCRLFPEVVCHLDFGWGNYIYPPLLVIVPFVAIMLFKSTVSRRVLKVAWVAVACIVLGMLVQMALVLTWGVLAWGTSQQEVAWLAYGYDRSLMPGDYHIWLGAGLALVLLCGGAAIAALVQGMPAMWTKNKSARKAGAVEVE